MKYKNYRDYSLEDLTAAKTALEHDIALCCYSGEELRRELDNGRRLDSLALSCINFLGELESRRIDRRRQVDRLKGN